MSTFDKQIFLEYLCAGLAVVPVNKKKPLIAGWNAIDYEQDSRDLVDSWYNEMSNITGIGIIIGGFNRQLACIDIDTNDPEIVERILKAFPSSVKKVGTKGCTIFFLNDGKHQKSQYKYVCPGGTGFIEVFYGNKQVVLPPSLHSDDNYYYWIDDNHTVLKVGIDNLPVISFDQIETIPTLINSPSITVANQNLPKSIQYTTDDLADGRYGAMMNFLATTVAKYNNRPKMSTLLIDCLNYDGEFFRNNSFFLYSTNKKRAEMKTEDRAINATMWISSVMKTFNANSGATFAEEDEVTHHTDSFGFNKIMPVENKIHTAEEPVFDTKLIPELWFSMVDDMSKAMGVPPVALFVSKLCALGACLQGKKVIQPVKNETFIQRPNMAICLVATSGSKKSDVLSIATHECKNIDKRLKTVNPKKLMEKMENIQSRIENLSKDKKRLSGQGEMEQAEQIALEIHALQDELNALEIKPTVFMYEIATIQKMILDASNNQGNGLFIVLDEFKQIMAMMKKKGNEDARAFFMKGIDGNKDFRYATIARGTDVIEEHFVSILTCIQPDVLNVIINDLHNPRNDSNDGFQQRFQLVRFGAPSTDRPGTIDVRRYARQYDLFNKAFGSSQETVHIAGDILDIYIDMRHEIRTRALRYHDKPVGSFLSKQEGLLCKYAYLYEFILSEGTSSVIGEPALKMAFDLLAYLAEEVKYIFSVSDEAMHISELNRLAEMIKGRFFEDGLTQSQWWQNARNSFRFPNDFTKCMFELESRGYIARIKHRKNGDIIKINPMIWSMVD